MVKAKKNIPENVKMNIGSIQKQLKMFISNEEIKKKNKHTFLMFEQNSIDFPMTISPMLCSVTNTDVYTSVDILFMKWYLCFRAGSSTSVHCCVNFVLLN